VSGAVPRRPRLAPHALLRWDALRGEHQVVGPEGVLSLGESAAAVLLACDGRTLEDLCRELAGRYEDFVPADVERFLAELSSRRWVRDDAG
jgi:pyrroloquinoline quinone biosynthesis protein D